MRKATFIIPVLYLAAVLVPACIIANCAGGPSPEDAEAIACIVSGGDWVDGACVYPDEKALCEKRCAPIPCHDREEDGAWECDWPCQEHNWTEECEDPDPEPEPTPPPVTKGRPFPQGIPEAEYTKIPATSERAEEVNVVMAEITGCNIGSRCLHNKSPQEWMQLVVIALREQGIDAGQHVDGETDEIAVRVPRNVCRWEGYHVTTYANKPTVVWNPGAVRPSYSIPPSYCEFPDPDPVAGCPVPQPTREKLVLDLKSHGHGKWDLTPKQKRACEYCKDIGMGDIGGVPRCGCPVRNEGDPFRSACEQFIMGGAPRWFCSGNEIPATKKNPYQAICAREVKACTVDLEVCSS